MLACRLLRLGQSAEANFLAAGPQQPWY